MSKPPNIGDPTKNAIVTIAAKAIPTAMNRLFILPNNLALDKKEMEIFWQRSGRRL